MIRAPGTVTQLIDAAARFRSLAMSTSPNAWERPQLILQAVFEKGEDDEKKTDEEKATDDLQQESDCLQESDHLQDDDPLQEDDLIEAMQPAWRRLLLVRKTDPRIFERVPARTLDDMLAEAYEQEGWDEVTFASTPSTTDARSDLLVTRRNFHASGNFRTSRNSGTTRNSRTSRNFRRVRSFCTIRFIDRVKRCPPDGRVRVSDIQKLLETLQNLPTSIGLVSTTADFAPTLRDHPLVKPLLPTRLVLRNRNDLLNWLKSSAARIEKRRRRARHSPSEAAHQQPRCTKTR